MQIFYEIHRFWTYLKMHVFPYLTVFCLKTNDVVIVIVMQLISSIKYEYIHLSYEFNTRLSTHYNYEFDYVVINTKYDETKISIILCINEKLNGLFVCFYECRNREILRLCKFWALLKSLVFFEDCGQTSNSRR